MAFYSFMDVYNKSYYLCNEVMMGLTIFSNYMGNNNAELKYRSNQKTTLENYDYVQMHISQ